MSDVNIKGNIQLLSVNPGFLHKVAWKNIKSLYLLCAIIYALSPTLSGYTCVFFFHERKKLEAWYKNAVLLPFNHLEWDCRASLWLENEVSICFFGQEAFIGNYWKSCRVNVVNWCVSLGFYCMSVRCSLEQYQPFTVMRFLLALLRADKPVFFFPIC